MSDILEARFTRKRFEKVFLMLEGNSVTIVMSNGWETRQDEFNRATHAEAETFYNESIVKILVEGFKKDG